MARWLSERVRWLPVAVVAGAILVAAVSQPGDAGSGLGPFGLVGVDKYLHALAFAALALALLGALTGSTGRNLAVVLALGVGYGVAIELLQLPIAYRSASLLDVVADATGAVAVVLCWRVGTWLRHRVQSGRQATKRL